jgi:hypothetical protein
MKPSKLLWRERLLTFRLEGGSFADQYGDLIH